MAEVKVEFDYEAEHDDELTIKEGQIITDVKISDGGWWEGQLNGKRGVFPDNFVKVIKKAGGGSGDHIAGSPAAGSTDKTAPGEAHPKGGGGGGNVAGLAKRLSSHGKPLGGTPKPLEKRSNADSLRHKRAKVAFSYAPQNEDELELKVDDVIELNREASEGWWEGSVGSRTGVFPNNYVQLIKEASAGAEGEAEKDHADGGGTQPGGEEEPEQPPTGQRLGSSEIKAKKIQGIGLGNIFQGGPIKLKKHGEEAKKAAATAPLLAVKKDTPLENRVASLRKSPSSRPLPSPSPSGAKKDKELHEKAKVLFAYNPENPDELKLVEGETIVVTDKDGSDEGWWKGQAHGKSGVFPDNFVQLLPREEDPAPKAKRVGVPLPLPGKHAPTPGTGTTESKSASLDRKSAAFLPPVKPSELPKDKNTDEKLGPDKPQKPMSWQKGGAPVPPKKPPPLKSKPPAPLPSQGLAAEPPARPMAPKPQQQETTPSITTLAPPSVTPASSQESSSNRSSTEITGQSSLDFDSLQPAEKLVHPTALRAKNPGRRPPSTLFIKGGPELNGGDGEEDTGKAQEAPWAKDLKVRRSVAERLISSAAKDSTDGGGPPNVAPKFKKTSLKPDRPPMPSPSSHSAGGLAPLVSPPGKAAGDGTAPEVGGAGGAGSGGVEELAGEVERLKGAVEKMKKEFKRELANLTGELDEEKKSRMTMQVEIQRLKKLVQDH